MMKCLLVFCIFIAVSSALFEIDELIKMITNPADIMTLKILDDDEYSPRLQIKKQVNNIVARQPKSVQKAYKMLVDNAKAKEKAELKRDWELLTMRGAPQAVLDARKEIYKIENDLSLSEMQADYKKMQVRASLNAADYMTFIDD